MAAQWLKGHPSPATSGSACSCHLATASSAPAGTATWRHGSPEGGAAAGGLLAFASASGHGVPNFHQIWTTLHLTLNIRDVPDALLTYTWARVQ